MWFGTKNVEEAEDLILAHSIRANGTLIKKGTVITRFHIEMLSLAGKKWITVAQIGRNNFSETIAARLIGEGLIKGTDLTMSAAFTGRVNIFSKSKGIFRVNRNQIDMANTIDPGITIATLNDYSQVGLAQILVTVKIIPYGVKKKSIKSVLKILNSKTLLVIRQVIKTADLILTKLHSTSPKLLKKSENVIRSRLLRLGVLLNSVEYVDHETSLVSRVINITKSELVLFLGCNATSDINDIGPEALKLSGGFVERFGMPVDPGNLLFLGSTVDLRPFIGLPGCSRSAALNGADWVLERLVCGMKVTSYDIAKMGVGGLLKENPTRPQSRNMKELNHDKNIEVVILAAGKSTRMNGTDKLLKIKNKITLITRVVKNAIDSNVSNVHVVLGHNAENRLKSLAGLPITWHLCPDYNEGMAASLRFGMRKISSSADAVIIALSDMPLVTAKDYSILIENYNTEKGHEICQSVSDSGKRGHPVLFGRRFFESLLALEGDEGGRSIIFRYQDYLKEVPTSGQGAVIDINSESDWKKWKHLI